MKLLVRLPGGVVEAEPLGIVGLHLSCRVERADGVREIRLIRANDAVRSDDFWKVWNAMGGQSLPLTWEDGEPFSPQGP